MRKIPPKLRSEIAKDPFYKQCCVTGRKDQKIDWHHNLIYSGRQVNEKFCILPLSKSVHDSIVYFKERCDWIMLNRATPEEIRAYSKAVNYERQLINLNRRFGKWSPDWYNRI